MTIQETLTPSAQVELQLPEGRMVVRAERAFMVTDTNPLSEAQVLSSGPALGSTHPNIPGLLCVGKAARPHRADLRSWELWCTYSNVTFTGSWTDNPLLRPPVITWSNIQYEEDFVRDISGRAVVNSAGDPFDPPLKIQRSRWQVTYKRNRPWVPAAILNYADAINSDEFILGGLTIPPRRAKLDRIEIGPLQVDNGIAYYEVGYTFTLQRDSWQPEILDQGMYQRAHGGRQRIRINGEPVTHPVLLDGRGHPFPLGYMNFGGVWLKDYKAYYELPFGPLL